MKRLIKYFRWKTSTIEKIFNVLMFIPFAVIGIATMVVITTTFIFPPNYQLNDFELSYGLAIRISSLISIFVFNIWALSVPYLAIIESFSDYIEKSTTKERKQELKTEEQNIKPKKTEIVKATYKDRNGKIGVRDIEIPIELVRI